MKSPKNNLLYNTIYQILILIIPLITAPYLSRVVGASGVGTYSYTYSIVYYFMMFTLLGLNNYGNRTIAKVRDNKKELSKTFWSIYIFQFLMGLLMIIAYSLYILLFDNSFKTIAIIQGMFIFSAMFDINWFFFGLEEFKKTITRNTIVKLSILVLIFVFVKNQNDLWKYTLIMSGMTFLGQLIIWPYLKNRINIIKVGFKDIKKHIKPNFVLFIPVVAISLYKIMDKIMIGSLSNVTEVGFYENAEKITNIPLTLITALGTVMLPRISNLVAKGDSIQTKRYIDKSMNYVMFMSLAMCFGLIGVGYHFAPMFFGVEFQRTGILIMLLAITLPFLSFANVLRTQYLIPKEKDRIYIRSVFLAAIVNLIMNFIFIPIYGSIGACFGTITAEFAVMFYQAYAIRQELPIKEYIINSIPFFIKSIIMLIVIYPFNWIEMNGLLRLFIQVSLGCLIYGLLNIKYILSIIDLKKLLSRYRKKRINA